MPGARHPAGRAKRRAGSATLRAAGCEALALPLIEIAPVPDTAELARAWRRRTDYRALMFVSGAAVDAFLLGRKCMKRPPAKRKQLSMLIAQPRCWATGPGTAAALREAGVPDRLIDAPPPQSAAVRFRSTVGLVRRQIGSRAAGADRARRRCAGRPQAATGSHARLSRPAAVCDTVVAYRRLAPGWTTASRRLAEAAAQAPAVWLFSSSEAIANLRRVLPQTSLARARAVATHPRIAERARDAGFGRCA